VGVVTIDARLLGTGPATIDAVLDAAIGDQVGEPLLLRIEGDWPSPPDLESAPAALRSVAALTLGTGEVPADLRSAFDLIVADRDAARRAEAAFTTSPHAALTAALLVRNDRDRSGAAPDVWAGLAAESAAYSMLLASPPFTRWRAEHAARPIDPEDAAAPRVTVEASGRVTVVTLVRGHRHNALDPRMRDELHGALAEAALGTGPVVLRGDGPSFCSGGDLDTFGSLPDPATAHVVRLARSVAWQAHRLGPRLVVGLHGACLGAGIEIPAFAAHVIAADDTRIGLPELALGLIPGAGGTVSIAHRSGPARVLELLLDDGTIPATTARDWGLVDDIVPRARLDARLLEIAEQLP
jgi:enoyl-CoA hydratase/carnithine racemase